MKINKWFYNEWKAYCVCLGLLLVGGMSGNAQQQATALQQQEYVRGNRDPQFLKEYVTALKVDQATEVLGEVMDAYLMTLPREQRYTGEHLVDFTTYVQRITAPSFIDLVKSWEQLSLSEKEKTNLVEKFEQICVSEMFAEMMKAKENGDSTIFDFSGVTGALAHSSMPVSASPRFLLEAWQSWRAKDVNGTISASGRVFTKPVTCQGIFDLSILAHITNYVLEQADIDQCRRMIDLLNKAITDFAGEPIADFAAKIKDNFEGKVLMIEMGEE